MAIRSTSRQQSSDSAISDGAEVPVLKLDLSDEDDNKESRVEIPPPPPVETPHSLLFKGELERSLEMQARNSRSVSRSPELDEKSSHMYVRSTGFRARTLSPEGASNKSNDYTSNPNVYNTNHFYRQDSSNTVEIPIIHSNGSGTHSFPVPMKSPDDRPAYNPGYMSLQGRRKTPPPVSPRPFPVGPPSSIPVMNNSNIRTHVYPTESATAAPRVPPGAALHMVSPVRHANPIVSYQSTSQTSPPYGRPVFHTFGGRARQRPTPPTMVNSQYPNPHSYDDNRNDRSSHKMSGGSGYGRSTGIPIATGIPIGRSATTPRRGMVSPAAGQTFYVLGDPHLRPQGGIKMPSRYNYNEEEDVRPTQPPKPPAFI